MRILPFALLTASLAIAPIESLAAAEAKAAASPPPDPSPLPIPRRMREQLLADIRAERPQRVFPRHEQSRSKKRRLPPRR